MAKLAIYRGAKLDRTVDLAERTYRVGRGEQSDIVLEDPDKAVSRLHAEIRFEGGSFVVVDLNSQNGIWLEGRRVPQAPLAAAGEAPGTAAGVQIGPYSLFLAPDKPAAAAPPPRSEPPKVESPKPPPQKPEPPRRAAEPAKPAAPGKPPAPSKPAKKTRISPVVWIGLAAVLLIGAVLAGLYWPSGSPVTRQDVATSQPSTATEQPPVSAAPPVTQPPAASGATAPAEITRVEPPAAVPVTPPPPAGAGQNPVVVAPQRATPAQPGTTPARPTAIPATKPGGGPPAATTDPTLPTRRPGESAQAYRNRARDVKLWFDQGTRALRSGDHATAVARLEAVLAAAPSYPEAAALLADARQGQKGAAQAVFAAGEKLEKEGDLPGALQQFERAKQMDASLEGLEQAMSRLRDRMRAQGEDAYKRARQYDALGRATEAVTYYERALQLLPADHDMRKAAKERLDVLKSIK